MIDNYFAIQEKHKNPKRKRHEIERITEIAKKKKVFFCQKTLKMLLAFAIENY